MYGLLWHVVAGGVQHRQDLISLTDELLEVAVAYYNIRAQYKLVPRTCVAVAVGGGGCPRVNGRRPQHRMCAFLCTISIDIILYVTCTQSAAPCHPLARTGA